ncbi:Ig-like domain-containing protein, partial [Nitratireductor sp. GCM10026969]|uniref:Ig-like domain-containing protein n=1 Tax=Nitratireductor sp. GCM10026969 TaxID=3252645 RepID=UPI003619F202
MASTPLKVLLFIAGALIAGSGAAYFAGAFDPVANGGQEMAGPSDPAGPALPSADEGSAPETGARLTDGEDTAGEQSEAAKDDVIVPAFDIVRVEPDGSLVVAGRAAPGSEVEIVSGSSVLATAKAGPSGDFAAVLDEELKPGEHNIVLRSTSSDHVAATSRETAVVSVPNAESGEVVALVQEPGEPSRLISMPQGGEGSGNRQGSGADEKVASGNAAGPIIPKEEGETGVEGAAGRHSVTDDATGTGQADGEAGAEDARQTADIRDEAGRRSGASDQTGAEAA